MSMLLQKRVRAGVAWLNETLGNDWPEFINRDELDMGSSENCILGQLFRGSSEDDGFIAVADLMDDDDWDVDWTVAHGFDHSPFFTYRDLTREWNEYLDGYEHLQESA